MDLSAERSIFVQWMAAPLLSPEAFPFVQGLIMQIAQRGVETEEFFANWSMEMMQDHFGRTVRLVYDSDNHVYATDADVLFCYGIVSTHPNPRAREEIITFIRPTFLTSPVARWTALGVTLCRYDVCNFGVFIEISECDPHLVHISRGWEHYREPVASVMASENDCIELQQEMVRLAAFDAAFYAPDKYQGRVTPVMFPDGTLVSIPCIPVNTPLRNPEQHLEPYRNILAISGSSQTCVCASYASNRACSVSVLLALSESDEHFNVVPVASFGLGADLLGRPNPWKIHLRFRVEKRLRQHVRILDKERKIAYIELVGRMIWHPGVKIQGPQYDRTLLMALNSVLSMASRNENISRLGVTSISRSMETILSNADSVNQQEVRATISAAISTEMIAIRIGYLARALQELGDAGSEDDDLGTIILDEELRGEDDGAVVDLCEDENDKN